MDKPNVAVWNDMYNGRRVNYGPNKTGTIPSPTGEKATTWGGNVYDVQYVKQSDEDKALNSGRTFVQLNLPNNSTGTNLSLGIGVEGPKETRIQQWLHYGKAYPQFELNDEKSEPFILTGGGYD